MATNTEAALPRLSGLGGHTQAGAASSTLPGPELVRVATQPNRHGSLTLVSSGTPTKPPPHTMQLGLTKSSQMQQPGVFPP